MAETQMTPPQVLQKLKVDTSFALGFALDNNFSAIAQRLADKGYIVATPTQATEVIKSLLASGKTDIIKYIFDVPYLNDAPNYTAGFKDYFLTAPVPVGQGGQKSVNWSGWLSLVGVALVGVGALTNTGTPTTAPTTTPAPTQAEIDAAAVAAAHKKTVQRNWIIGIGIGVIVLAIGIWHFTKGDKPEKTK